jgi:hypothetical protein
LATTSVFRVYGVVMAKFYREPDLCQRVRSVQKIPDSANRSSSDGHNLEIANRLELRNGPLESLESCLPDWYLELPEFRLS